MCVAVIYGSHPGLSVKSETQRNSREREASHNEEETFSENLKYLKYEAISKKEILVISSSVNTEKPVVGYLQLSSVMMRKLIRELLYQISEKYNMRM